ncbi:MULTISPECIES: hypothetical protein [Actinosynnema]|uniref:hypothetical protein n=1 Tax=Actinosynnema TaxID=40566 RepID=UPI0020A37CD2|nr:hypothetical protein [Actinosynnema pretiosum]MCP2099917.1 hypothetical protein [Actinosynnema pretiosum]
MDFAELSTERLHEVAVHLAAAEALRRTRYRVEVLTEPRSRLLLVGGRRVRVFARRTAEQRPMRRGTGQDTSDAHALVFVDLSGAVPRFHLTAPDVAVGRVEEGLDDWPLLERLDARG